MAGDQFELGMETMTLCKPTFNETVSGVTPALSPSTMTFAGDGVEVMRRVAFLAYSDAGNATAATIISITALSARMARSKGELISAPNS
jgi:hypothetical protein